MCTLRQGHTHARTHARNVRWFSHFGKALGSIFIKISIYLQWGERKEGRGKKKEEKEKVCRSSHIWSNPKVPGIEQSLETEQNAKSWV